MLSGTELDEKRDTTVQISVFPQISNYFCKGAMMVSLLFYMFYTQKPKTHKTDETTNSTSMQHSSAPDCQQNCCGQFNIFDISVCISEPF